MSGASSIFMQHVHPHHYYHCHHNAKAHSNAKHNINLLPWLLCISHDLAAHILRVQFCIQLQLAVAHSNLNIMPQFFYNIVTYGASNFPEITRV